MRKLTIFAAALSLVFATSSVFGAVGEASSTPSTANDNMMKSNSSYSTKSDNSMKPANQAAIQSPIIDIALNHPGFSMFVSALRAADLVSVLQGPGPFTVFIPTNDAFAKLPNGKLQELLKPENKDKLRAILLYHVVPGNVLLSNAKTMTAKTQNGKDLNVVVNGNTVKINNASVTKAAIVGSNGVIYVIDTVLMP